MPNGANSIHKLLRTQLEDYIVSQYFGKSKVLRSAITPLIDTEGLMYRRPYIESTPAYKTVPNGIEQANLPEWMRNFFVDLSRENLGVHKAPFEHQLKALENFTLGQDLFVATGTGSGKTECFMWPLIAKLAMEAHDSPETWKYRGVRTVIMYPMNALVSDQVSRLRRLIGDKEGRFISLFRKTCGEDMRRPQFGMYTGRTPYPGPQSNSDADKDLARTLTRMSFPQNETEKEYYEKLSKEGKIPAKADMQTYLHHLREGIHEPDPNDAELITRFEMQKYSPDILITNYSMLEYMLFRPREQKIWEDTKRWLASDKGNKLLFIIDEAHMYRGSSGGEVALLIRRLFHKLGINRDRVQFILTTASMPTSTEEDSAKVFKFANALTASDQEKQFCYLTGDRENIEGKQKYDIPFSVFETSNPSDFEESSTQLEALRIFWRNASQNCPHFSSVDEATLWMYDNLVHYRPFYELMRQCRGNAVSLEELAESIFPTQEIGKALEAVGVLLAIAPLAKNSQGSVLFPARMHMLFKGIKGVYACTNPHCRSSQTDGKITLGKIFLTEGNLICPDCGSVVYELYNDRRCGALYFKGYVLGDDFDTSTAEYLWRYPGQQLNTTTSTKLYEIHLFIPSEEFAPKDYQGDYPVKPCYLDTQSGFINFRDDSQAASPTVRKLYFCKYPAKGRPNTITFTRCPHCTHSFSQAQLSSFSTRGNLSFFSLVNAQFQSQPAVRGKDNMPERLPNQGRKVLLFSDSRQQAARLARDMSDISDIAAARQLFTLAIIEMEKAGVEYSMEQLYDYFCLLAEKQHVQIFHDRERDRFADDCKEAYENYQLAEEDDEEYVPQLSMSNSPQKMQEFLLRLFAGGYNTLYDSALCWIEPTKPVLKKALRKLKKEGLDVTEEQFLELFNAWLLDIFDKYTALGHRIPDSTRMNIRKTYGRKYGLDSNWSFSRDIMKTMQWKNDSPDLLAWRRVLQSSFLENLQQDNGRLYLDISQIKPRYDESHQWYRCDTCSNVMPMLFRNRCPHCFADTVHVMEQDEYEAFDFWRKSVEDAKSGAPIRVIDTEEHTAQVSHKDQLDDMWSLTEKYELRFQDYIQDNETPVDILSSTTTMEVGIDIGSLVAVGLRNIPPLRENYQQRAGRAGRRGASLSTIVTFCEDGPHDTMYFNNPVPMFRGDPRTPWIDIASEKLIQRHLNIVVLQEFLERNSESMDLLPAGKFVDVYLADFSEFLMSYCLDFSSCLIPRGNNIDLEKVKQALLDSLKQLKEKRKSHPELYGMDGNVDDSKKKKILDALYEEGIIPTYSFPKNVVSTYIEDEKGKVKYEVSRDMGVAIGEYAPGRSIVVDKKTYQIGGLFFPGSEKRSGAARSPARAYLADDNYVKKILECPNCKWFGLDEENHKSCPFCGNGNLHRRNRDMVKPWGFAPRNGTDIQLAQLEESYSSASEPLYSTLPKQDEMCSIDGYQNLRLAARSNQRLIMMNRGPGDKGFMICNDCGAVLPGNDAKVLDDIQRPYKISFAINKCKHTNCSNIDLGFDFRTDMLVLEIKLDHQQIETHDKNNQWLSRAARSFAEALRLIASNDLAIEFSELITGYRIRQEIDYTCVDVYMYDSLSSGAGYAIAAAEKINGILEKMRSLLSGCTCDSACHSCLKHYQNRYVHGNLDRFAGLELLNWAQRAELAKPLSVEYQRKLILPLRSILNLSGCNLDINGEEILISKRTTKKLIIYPAMWIEPYDPDTIYVSDAYMKYAKPYAVNKINRELF